MLTDQYILFSLTASVYSKKKSYVCILKNEFYNLASQEQLSEQILFFFILKIICSNLQKGLGSKRQSTGTLCLVEGYFNCSGFSLSETQCNFVTLLFAQSYHSYCSLSHTHLDDV